MSLGFAKLLADERNPQQELTVMLLEQERLRKADGVRKFSNAANAASEIEPREFGR